MRVKPSWPASLFLVWTSSLALSPARAEAARQEPPPEDLPVIEHDALQCVLKDRLVQVEAVIRPAAAVTRARVYFTSAAEKDYYVAVMRPEAADRFVATLPKPKPKAAPVVYFIEVVATGGALQRTPETRVQVVGKPDACPDGGRVAAESEGDDVTILSTIATPTKPKGFGGVARVQPAPEVAAASVGETAATSTPVAGPAQGEEASQGAHTPGAEPATARAAEPARPNVQPPVPAAPAGAGTSLSPLSPESAEPLQFALGPEDILKVTVVGHDDLTQTLILQSDGTFIYPLLGRLKASDLTPKELEGKLTALLAQGYIRNPQVSVTVQEYRSKTVMVMGEVSRPGPYPLSGNLRLLEMLAKAGISSSAGTVVQVLRPLGPAARPLLPNEVAEGSPAAAQAETIDVDLRAIQLGNLERNLLLRPNDTVYVPPAARFYVTGEVRSPGAHTLTLGLTIREAVILSGGFSESASAGRTRVIREVDGQKREVKIKLDDVVQPGDIIVVKGKLF